MSKVIVHIGSPKTGTTSIQASLAHSLSDSRFRFISGTSSQGNLAALCLFGGNCERYLKVRRINSSASNRERLRRSANKQWSLRLRDALADNVTPIVSSETCWKFDEAEYRDLRKFFEDRGFEVQIVAFLRPVLDYLSSAFQQLVKWQRMDWDSFLAEQAAVDYWKKIKMLDHVFGTANVTLASYDPSRFPNGCVTQEFSSLIGLGMTPLQSTRRNESLSQDAVKLVYALDRSTSLQQVAWKDQVKRSLLVRKMLELEGSEFKFHPAVFKQLESAFWKRKDLLEQRLDCSFCFSTDSVLDDHVRSEDSLFDYSQSTLDWLAANSGAPVLITRSGDNLSRQVVRQLKQIPLYTDVDILRQEARNIASRVRQTFSPLFSR
ncbi:MAG: hypothetical protein P8N76_25870 [Pirellulaceae bacterium]|nr:hypothetical protein [Pirellulaceae bacterium]